MTNEELKDRLFSPLVTNGGHGDNYSVWRVGMGYESDVMGAIEIIRQEGFKDKWGGEIK